MSQYWCCRTWVGLDKCRLGPNKVVFPSYHFPIKTLLVKTGTALNLPFRCFDTFLAIWTNTFRNWDKLGSSENWTNTDVKWMKLWVGLNSKKTASWSEAQSQRLTYKVLSIIRTARFYYLESPVLSESLVNQQSAIYVIIVSVSFSSNCEERAREARNEGGSAVWSGQRPLVSSVPLSSTIFVITFFLKINLDVKWCWGICNLFQGVPTV